MTHSEAACVAAAIMETCRLGLGDGLALAARLLPDVDWRAAIASGVAELPMQPYHDALERERLREGWRREATRKLRLYVAPSTEPAGEVTP